MDELAWSLIGLALVVLTSWATNLRPFDGARTRRRAEGFARGREVAVPFRWEDVPPNTNTRFQTYSVEAVAKCSPRGWTCENWNSMLGPPERFLAELASASTEVYGKGVGDRRDRESSVRWGDRRSAEGVRPRHLAHVRRGRHMKSPMKSPFLLSQQQQGRLHARLHGSRGDDG